MYTLLYIKYITNKNLLYSTGNSTQYSIMTYMGKEPKKEWMHVYVLLIYFAIQQKLTQHYKSPMMQKKKIEKINKYKLSGLRSLGGRNGNPLQYSCLESSMDRGACWATVHEVAKSWTWLKQLSTAQWLSTYAYFLQYVSVEISDPSGWLSLNNDSVILAPHNLWLYCF